MPEYALDTSLSRDTWKALDAFTRAYIEAAMWTLTGDDGDSLDHLGLHDIAEETIATAVRECAAFQHTHSFLIRASYKLGATDARNGHDFWLTRNRHGAGFWDRGYPGDMGQALTDAAHAEGSVDWYLGDDGMVYQQ